MIPHPIPYQGSKRNLAKQILGFFPEKTERLIEPFAGSAAVSLAALHCASVNSVFIGDSNGALMALWEQIIHAPAQLAQAYTSIWNQQLGREREYYDYVRAEFNRTQRPDFFLYLLARCVKAAVRYNANGEFNQSPDNRRRGTQPIQMTRNIMGASALLKNRSHTQHADYRVLLEEATTNDLVYLDPPYQGVVGKRDPRYKEKIHLDHFTDALGDLNLRNIPYIVSYDGRTGQKTYGNPLPSWLGLKHIELDAGRSSQATLHGRNEVTFESLYLSPALIDKLAERTPQNAAPEQLDLFGI
jgi:DNA adenine methylase